MFFLGCSSVSFLGCSRVFRSVLGFMWPAGSKPPSSLWVFTGESCFCPSLLDGFGCSWMSLDVAVLCFLEFNVCWGCGSNRFFLFLTSCFGLCFLGVVCNLPSFVTSQDLGSDGVGCIFVQFCLLWQLM